MAKRQCKRASLLEHLQQAHIGVFFVIAGDYFYFATKARRDWAYGPFYPTQEGTRCMFARNGLHGDMD